MKAVRPVSEGRFYPIDPDQSDQCLLVLISGYLFCGIWITKERTFGSGVGPTRSAFQWLRLGLKKEFYCVSGFRMRIAVISDTHNRYPASLPEKLREADEIWHLGDVCAPETLVEFEQLGPPLRIVVGNCDAFPWPGSLDLERAGTRFHLIHIPPRIAPKHAQVILHGHTHVPRDETDERGVRWLNPGCITRPNRGAPASYAWLTLTREKMLGWELVRV